MSPSLLRRHRLLMSLYPRRFRERYGAELRALVEDTSSSERMTLDLALGVLKAWTGPSSAGMPE
ncbi:MAG: hypothetical protein WCB86_06395 [Candidatus Dormiibacterota bacterium]